MRSLEDEVELLKSQLRATEHAEAGPELPVQVLEPPVRPDEPPVRSSEPPVEAGAPPVPAGAADPVAQPDDYYDVAGFDDDSLEIVYVGDAAQDRSVKPRPLPDEVSAGVAPAPRTEAPLAPEPASTPARAHAAAIQDPGPGQADHLLVTEDIGPTVERQLRQAAQQRAAGQPTSTSMLAREAPLPPLLAAKDPAPDHADPRAQYQRYYDALKAGNHTFAIAGFRNFIERFPNHEYADNARYWLAEAFYDKRDYRAALTEFRRVVREYPQGNKVPDALLKIAYCQLALGETAEARAVLARVIETFPQSNPAALAAQRLETLKD